ncbi:hypothetical protein SO802_027679 [Lithocarpus litseifolius]|uniref:Uncharacterized protein n=1 Tax=Lithocarpus litseifolius TaxID=425828 RepID=A0AAW2C395_9ROSI
MVAARDESLRDGGTARDESLRDGGTARDESFRDGGTARDESLRDGGTAIGDESFRDGGACYWTNCGGGFCNKTSNFTYSCECAKDYYNILDDTSLPCFQDCAIGMDCSILGISSSNKSTSATQVVSDDATSTLQGHYLWLITLMTFMAVVQWK